MSICMSHKYIAPATTSNQMLFTYLKIWNHNGRVNNASEIYAYDLNLLISRIFKFLYPFIVIKYGVNLDD